MVGLALAGALASLLLPQPSPDPTAGFAQLLSFAIAAAVPGTLLILALLVGTGRLAAAGEPEVWQRVSLGVACIAGAAVIAAILPLVTQQPETATGGLSSGLIALEMGCALACIPFFHGLIHWNRARATYDPDDWLNALGGVLVGSAALELAVRFVPLPPGQTATDRHVLVVATTATIVSLATTLSVSGQAASARDRRFWALGIGLAGALAVQVTALRSAEGLPLLRPVWLVAAALIVVCPFTPLKVPWWRQSSSRSTSRGAFSVLLGSLAVLAVHGAVLHQPQRLVLVYACAAVAASSMRFLRLVRDLSTLAERRREALSDDLTGLPNRRALMSAIRSALRSGELASLLVMDLDGFKEINDLHGHGAGDEVLRHLALACGEVMPRGAVFGRLGGDEFAVLLAGGIGDPEDVARSVRAAVSGLDVATPRLQLDMSIGVSEATGPGTAEDELLRRADVAMYEAKRTHAGVVRYDSALDTTSREQKRLASELAEALADPDRLREQLVVFFQPQVGVATGEVVGAEALIRWQHPRLGLLAPDAFLHLADREVLMTVLTGHVVQTAADQAETWRKAGHRLRIAANIPATLLAHPSLLALLEERLADGLDPDLLVLEVTETSLMTDPDRALTAAWNIAERGLAISIDDYGTAYSSLSYLRDLPATELKIDRSFTIRMTSDRRTRAIVAATVELAHRLGMTIVIEGVETEEVRRLAYRLGCDDAQGYLFSRPLPAAEFQDWLAGWVPRPAEPGAGPGAGPGPGQGAGEDLATGPEAELVAGLGAGAGAEDLRHG